MYLHFTSLLEKSAENVFEKPNHSNIKLTNETTEMYSLGFRFLSLLCMAGVATFFGLRPSRTIREIIVHKVCRTSLNIEVKFVNLKLKALVLSIK